MAQSNRCLHAWGLSGLSLLSAILLLAVLVVLVQREASAKHSTHAVDGLFSAMQSMAFSPPEAITDTTPPSIPAGLVVISITQTTATMAWEAAADDTGVTGYRLYERVKANPYFSYWLLRIDNLVTTTATASNLEPGSLHNYAVAAFDAAGNESPKSVIVQAHTLQAPLAFHPGGLGEHIAAIVDTFFQYEVDALGEPPPTFALVAGPTGMTVDLVSGLVQWTPTVADQGVVTATVRATNSEGSDDHTFTFPVYPAGTDLEPPGSVANLAATAITTRGATLTWNPATDNVGVVGYRILAQRESHGQSLFVAGDSAGAGTSFTVTTLQPGAGYRLWVAAYDAAGNEASISGATPVHIVTLADQTLTPTPTPTHTLAPTEPTPTHTETPTHTPTATPLPGSHVQIDVEPALPTANEVISLTVSGVYTSSCTPQYQTHAITDHLIAIQSAVPDEPFCLPAQFPWGFTIQVGPLPPGAYTVTHSLGTITDAAYFTVTDEPAPPTTPIPSQTDAPQPAATATPTATDTPPSIQVERAGESLTAIIGEAFHYTIEATGAPSPTFTLLAAPPGMTIDPTSGLLTWTPPEDAEGESMVAVRATNNSGSDEYTFQIVVGASGSSRIFLPLIEANK